MRDRHHRLQTRSRMLCAALKRRTFELWESGRGEQPLDDGGLAARSLPGQEIRREVSDESHHHDQDEAKEDQARVVRSAPPREGPRGSR